MIGGRAVRRRLSRLAGSRVPGRTRLAAVVTRRRAVLLMAGGTIVAAGVTGAFGGVVAALLVLGYALLALRALRRTVTERGLAARRDEALDLIGGLAADLRAGVTASVAVESTRAAIAPGRTDPQVGRALALLSVAYQVSEHLGAPLADLLERVEHDLRAAERARIAVAAQTTGARASAGLLALLPVAGVGLGYAMGARPVHTLLHTPSGAVCALTALALQYGGLSWTGRLCRSAVERAS